MTDEQFLAAAWTYIAPNRDQSIPFPRGFWPDLARIAMAMKEQNTTQPFLNFIPCRCVRGSHPEPARREAKTSPRKISAAAKAANTAALLAAIRAGAGNND